MTKSFTYLAVTLFSLSLPVQTWALVSQGPAQDKVPDTYAMAQTGVDLLDAPECPLESSATTTANETGGAVAATGDLASDARTTSCCWVYYIGSWYCVHC